MLATMMLVGTSSWAPTRQPFTSRRTSGLCRLATTAASVAMEECLAEAADGAAADGCAIARPGEVLGRYLQLRTVLAGEPLPDSVVESLIRSAEAKYGNAPFDEAKIWGDWQLVWQYNGKSATKSQKALAPLPQFSNFMLDESGTKVFRNIVSITKRRCRVVADVEYSPLPCNSENPGRLNSTIGAAYVEAAVGRRFGWKPLRLRLPLKGQGWLDVTYLSSSMRITRGNRGGIFVHLRPGMLTSSGVWPAVGGSAGAHRMAGRRPPPRSAVALA